MGGGRGRCFQNCHTQAKRWFGANKNEEMHIFSKGGYLRAARVEKVESLGAAKAENRGLSRGTYPYCPNMGIPPPRWVLVITTDLTVPLRFL